MLSKKYLIRFEIFENICICSSNNNNNNNNNNN